MHTWHTRVREMMSRVKDMLIFLLHIQLINASGQFMSKMSVAREILQCDNAILQRLHTKIINS